LPACRQPRKESLASTSIELTENVVEQEERGLPVPFREKIGFGQYER
jgi:hypothetical protein